MNDEQRKIMQKIVETLKEGADYNIASSVVFGMLASYLNRFVECEDKDGK